MEKDKKENIEEQYNEGQEHYKESEEHKCCGKCHGKDCTNKN